MCIRDRSTPGGSPRRPRSREACGAGGRRAWASDAGPAPRGSADPRAAPRRARFGPRRAGSWRGNRSGEDDRAPRRDPLATLRLDGDGEGRRATPGQDVGANLGEDPAVRAGRQEPCGDRLPIADEPQLVVARGLRGEALPEEEGATARVEENDARALREGSRRARGWLELSLIHISEPTRLLSMLYAVFC